MEITVTHLDRCREPDAHSPPGISSSLSSALTRGRLTGSSTHTHTGRVVYYNVCLTATYGLLFEIPGSRGKGGAEPVDSQTGLLSSPCAVHPQRRSVFWGGRGVDEGGNNWNLETFLGNSLPTALLLLNRPCCVSYFCQTVSCPWPPVPLLPSPPRAGAPSGFGTHIFWG